MRYHDKKKRKHKNKGKTKKRKNIMDLTITIVIPEVHVEKFVELLCLGGYYKEYIDDPDNEGEMIPNPVTNEEFALEQANKILMHYAQKQNIRRKEKVLKKALQEAEENESDLDKFLKGEEE